MKLTRVPSRAAPMATWIAPTMKVRVMAKTTYCSEPGGAITLRALNSTMEAAVVGPDTKCQEEPNSAATMAGTMAA